MFSRYQIIETDSIWPRLALKLLRSLAIHYIK